MKKAAIHLSMIVMAFSGLILLFLVGFVTEGQMRGTDLTGNIAAEGGKVTQLDIRTNTAPQFWAAVYGSYNSLGSSSVLLSGGDVAQTDVLSVYPLSTQYYIVATESSSLDWADVQPISTSFVDASMGLGPAHPQSGTTTFDGLYNFTFNYTTYELRGTETNSLNGTYITAVVMVGGKLVYVTKYVGGIGFMNVSTGYQMLLPMTNTTTQYYLRVLTPRQIGTSPNVSCPDNFMVDAKIASDNSTVELSWDDISATNYTVYYADGLYNNTIVFNNATLITESTQLNYLDSTNSPNRFFAVEANYEQGSCFTNNTAATYDIPLRVTANLVSFPLEFTNDTVKEILRPIKNKFSTLNEYNNTDRRYLYYIQLDDKVISNFEKITRGKGYWLTVNENTSLRIAGRVAYDIDEDVITGPNMLGFPVVVTNQTIAYNLATIDGTYSTVNVYDNINKKYDYYIVLDDKLIYNFNTITPTKGYWINVEENGTIILP